MPITYVVLGGTGKLSSELKDTAWLIFFLLVEIKYPADFKCTFLIKYSNIFMYIPLYL